MVASLQDKSAPPSRNDGSGSSFFMASDRGTAHRHSMASPSGHASSTRTTPPCLPRLADPADPSAGRPTRNAAFSLGNTAGRRFRLAETC